MLKSRNDLLAFGQPKTQHGHFFVARASDAGKRNLAHRTALALLWPLTVSVTSNSTGVSVAQSEGNCPAGARGSPRPYICSDPTKSNALSLRVGANRHLLHRNQGDPASGVTRARVGAPATGHIQSARK